MKVIGIGINKTGTTTLGRALEILGYDCHYSWSQELTEKWSEGEMGELLNFAASYNNLEDFPWCLMYKELDEYFDDAFFVLTTRKSNKLWYKSQCKHYFREQKEATYVINKLVYGFSNPNDNKRAYLEKYEQHNQNIREYFKGKSNFLELCWERNDGWEELCDFLGKDIPNEPFPFLNKSPSKTDKLKATLKRYLNKLK